MNRFHNAHLIAQGASNPSGVARALVAAIDEARQECADTDSVRADPACRLITYQLAHLFGMEPVSSPYGSDREGGQNYTADAGLCDRVANFTEAQYAKLREKWLAWAQSAAENPTGVPQCPTFPAFLNEAQPVFGTSDHEGHAAVAVPWCGMYLCIEPDGYSHT